MGINPDALLKAVVSDIGCLVEPFDSTPRPDISYRQYAASYMYSSIVRKWIPSDTAEADESARDSFIAANNRCRDWKPDLGSSWDDELFGEIRRVLESFLEPSTGSYLFQSYYDLLKEGRTGPGVANGVLGTSLYEKLFDSALTSTSETLYTLYKGYAEWFDDFSDAERQRYEKHGSPRIISGSKCSFVPKTSRTSRMICIEPVLNQYFQLGLGALLTKRLKSYFSIDLECQPEVNRRLAQEGSETGSFATIDLSSASDSISLRLCEELFPKWFFDTLLELRSHSTSIDGKTVPLFMMSTMGNGFTFPLQTIIFSAVVTAVIRQSGDQTMRWSVFGDDIIVPTIISRRVVSALEKLGFSVNSSKTFLEGPFRESCGADWFKGRPVRPVFIKKLDTPYDIMVAINQLNHWTAYTGIQMAETTSFLFKKLDKRFRTFCPYFTNFDEGIQVPLAAIEPKRDRNHSYLFYSWGRRPSRIKVGDGVIHHPSGLRRELLFNSSGLYMSFLYGELTDGTITVRHSLKLYRKKLRCSPYWDYFPLKERGYNGVTISWRQWETAVHQNLVQVLAETPVRA